MAEKRQKYFLMLLCGLIVIQPFLDVMWLNDGSVPEILGFTIPTLVRMLMVAVLGVFSFFVIRFNKKYLFMVLYGILIIIYFVIHHFHCSSDFQSLVPGGFGYSFLSELFYIVRMCIPIAIIYFTYNSVINRKSFEKCVITTSLIMSVSMIIANIFKIAFGSYTSVKIDGNIIDWFVNPDAFVSNQLASKGFFYSSITSTVLVLFYPYLLYLFFKHKKVRYFAVAALQSIALFMVGTKATSLSSVIVTVLMILVYLFVTLIKRDYKISKVALAGCAFFLILNSVLMAVAPATSKMEFDAQYSKDIDEDIDGTSKDYDLTEEDKEEIIAFFDENYAYLSINEEFMLKSYPYKYDPVFWYEFYADHVPSQRMQNRIVEEEILKRVKEVNDNKMDDWFGIGYTRTSNIYNLEKDFVYQYYSVGIVGVVLLLGPYIGILLFVMLRMLVHFKKRVTVFNCALVLGIGLSLFLAYYSGNALENLGVTIALGFAYGFLLKENQKKQEAVTGEKIDEK